MDPYDESKHFISEVTQGLAGVGIFFTLAFGFGAMPQFHWVVLMLYLGCVWLCAKFLFWLCYGLKPENRPLRAPAKPIA